MATILGSSLHQAQNAMIGVQAVTFPIAGGGTQDTADNLVLGYVPFDLIVLQTIVNINTAHGATCVANIGHGHLDGGVTLTVTDEDSIATAVNLDAAAPAVYLPPKTTYGDTIPATWSASQVGRLLTGDDNVFTLKISTSAISNTNYTGEVTFLVVHA